MSDFSYGVWDIETRQIDEGEIVFICGAHFDGVTMFSSTDERAFALSLIEAAKKRPYYAHNGGKFDDMWLIGWLRENEPRMLFRGSAACSGSRIIALDIDGATFLDSYALLPSSMRKLIKVFGVGEKGQFAACETIQETVEYCEDDCRKQHAVLHKFQRILMTFGVDLGTTIASVSMRAFRKWRGEEGRIKQYRFVYDKSFPGFKRPLYEIERASYAGGRVEVFNYNPGVVECLDYNSMYPDVMAKNVFPTGSPRFHGGGRRFNYIVNKNRPGLAQVDIEVPSCHIPATWIRDEHRLLFPTGVMKGIYTIAEINYFLELGYKIKKVHFYVTYDRAERIFAGWVDRLYERRLQAKRDGNGPLSEALKLLMNSLYGKFAEQEESEIIYLDYPTHEQLEADGFQGLHDLRIIGPAGSPYQLYAGQSTSTKLHVRPIIASYVTSYGRIKLHRGANASPYDMAYCDTDSLHTKYTRFNTDEHRLGALAWEKRADGRYLAPKMYELQHTPDCGCGKCQKEGKPVLERKHKGFGAVDALEVGGKETKNLVNIASLKECSIRGVGLYGIRKKKEIKEENPKRQRLDNGETRPWEYDVVDGENRRVQR